MSGLNRKKVAVLGGGAGALSAAFGITEMPGWQEQYEITVYQMGWRLGGKGASGRNAASGQRIQEHGLHVWAGFYENAFRVIRECYKSLARPADAPLATWQEAFKPHSFVTLLEQVGNGWKPWNLTLPTNSSVPGDDGELPTTWDYVTMMLQWADEIAHGLTAQEATSKPSSTGPRKWLDRLVSWAESRLTDTLTTAASAFSTEHETPQQLLTKARRIADAAPSDVHDHSAVLHAGIKALLDAAHAGLKVDLNTMSDEDRHLFILVNLGLSTVRGILADGALFHGLSHLDQWEWTDWLLRHGAFEQTLQSAVVRSTYDYIFGYKNGDVRQRCAGAGTTTHGLARLFFTYKGAFFFLMQAGMGDTVFAPMYQVLKQRGVKFEYFHRVEKLSLSSDRKSIASIEMAVQATIKNDAVYEPLIDVKGLPCWPDRPLYTQLVEGEAIESGKFDLESAWSAWKDPKKCTLLEGKDFDLVVLGIAIGALPQICGELIESSPRWKTMVEKVQTTPTHAFQLWLEDDVTSLGWDYGPTIAAAFAEPSSCFGDLSHLIVREDWTGDLSPKTIAYFCGPLADPAVIPPFSDIAFPGQRADEVRKAAIAWLDAYTRWFWPLAADAKTFFWRKLVATPGLEGHDRFDMQYWRANDNPTERYVLSAPGSAQARMRSDETDFANLYVAGDWVSTAFNAGCVEAAVMGGLQASRAICGYPRNIVGSLD
jgi:uncharacterized protein with NAD-binding domain and iron-sulfur cluster